MPPTPVTTLTTTTASASASTSAAVNSSVTQFAQPVVTPLTDSDMYDRVISAILDHQLPPGTKLVEDKLAAAFGVSRTRIRPVLVRLANERVVTLTPRRGATIAQPTEQEAHEVFEVRRLIEPTLVALFIANAADTDMEQLKRCIDDEESARLAGDTQRAIRLAGDFHLQIAERANHQTLARLLRELISRTSLILMAYGNPVERRRNTPAACACREHRILLDAIRLRDVRVAGQCMETHLTQLEAQLMFSPRASKALDLSTLFATAG